MTQISIELKKDIPSGESHGLTVQQIDAIRDFRASGFEVSINGQSLEAYTSVDGAMPEAIVNFGADALKFATTVVNREVAAMRSSGG